MEYYCIMVLTGEEKSFKALATDSLKELFPSVRFYFFERKLFNARRGWFNAPLFPSYLFFSIDEMSADFFEKLRKIKGFCRILPDNQHPVQIKGSSLEELKLFMQNGELWGVSTVRFLPGQKIKAVSGPLVGFEGNVVMVNKKRRQITVQSNVTGSPIKFDLKYEEAEKAEEI